MSEDLISGIIRIDPDYPGLCRYKGITQKKVFEKSDMSIFTVSMVENWNLTGFIVTVYIKLLLVIGCNEIIARLSLENNIKK
ncbi:MAG: hypothetical protein LBQ22_00830 [Bacteroidales bacterium]|nr:hypothetical protein [Bacteroidales bacterium]